MRTAFDRRRRTIVRMLNEIDGVVCPEPQGAFYAYPSVKGLLGKEIRGRRPATSVELAALVLDEAEVAVVPGEAFGTPGYLRLSYALGDADLARASPGSRNCWARRATDRRDPGVIARTYDGPPVRTVIAGSGLDRGPAYSRIWGWRVMSPCSPRPTCICTSPAPCGPHPAGARRPLRGAPARRPHLGRTAEAARHRRARLVPVPAALRHRAFGAARSRGHPAAGPRGRQEELRDGSGWLEIQVDPTSYAPRLGGLIPTLEIILDAVATASRDTGVGIAVLVAANRMKHPLEARTLARLAVRYADRGVVGFGLSNDERRGLARDFDRAFAIARRRRAARRAARRRVVGTAQRPRLPGRPARRPRSGTACGRRRTPRCSPGSPNAP